MIFFFNFSLQLFIRFKNGTFIGMIAEVGNGLVDASATGFASTYERSEIVDFAPMIDTSEQRVIIKTPNKSDYISYLIRNLYFKSENLLFITNSEKHFFSIFKFIMAFSINIHHLHCTFIDNEFLLTTKEWC